MTRKPIRRFILPAILLLFWLTPAAQQPPLLHYTTADGLIDNNTYGIIQDERGFFWIATESGVSRFDGNRFVNFSRKKDGLGDDEIVVQSAAGNDRIWFGGFNGSLSYYSFATRSVHNLDNNLVLKAIHRKYGIKMLLRHLEGVADGSIACIAQGLEVFHVSDTGVVTIKEAYPESPLLKDRSIYLTQTTGKLNIYDDSGRIFTLKNGRVTQAGVIAGLPVPVKFTGASEGYLFAKDSRENVYVCREYENGGCRVEFSFRSEFEVIRMYRAGKGWRGYWIQTPCNGAYWFAGGEALRQGRYALHILQGVCLRNIIFDHTGNVWFAAHTKGIYYLNTASRIAYRPGPAPHTGQQPPLICIGGRGAQFVWAGNSAGAVMNVQNGATVQVVERPLFSMRIKALLVSGRQQLWCATDGSLYLLPPGVPNRRVRFKKISHKALVTLKQICETPDGSVWAGTSSGLYRLPRGDTSRADTVSTARVTALCNGAGNTVWAALTDSLIAVNGQTVTPASWHPPRGRFITSLATTAGGLLWAGMQSDGITVLRNNRELAVINDNTPGRQLRLPGSFCRALFAADDSTVWVATDRGLHKIVVKTIEPFTYFVRSYTRADGLDNNDVTGVYAYGRQVWAVTATGINMFTDTAVLQALAPRSFAEEVRPLAGSTGLLKSGALLPHSSNSLVFSFTAASARPGDKTEYEVKLEGYDTAWRRSDVTTVQYTLLSPGRYKFYVRAATLNQDWGPPSEPFVFTIRKAWWQTGIFKLAAAAVTAVLLWLVARNIKRRARKNADTSRQMAELRLEAVRAQMNPHFIYNCLNSIQYYIGENDTQSAQYYLAGFGRLIRNTLDYSKKNYITLNEEITYISNYLSLEKMRLEDRFDYTVSAGGIDSANTLQLPPMLLQPYVENAIRHGIRPLKDKKGLLTIRFTDVNGCLQCVIEDNGVGRQPGAPADGVHGMAISSSRVESLNMFSRKKITVEVTDLNKTGFPGSGTRVTLNIPATAVKTD